MPLYMFRASVQLREKSKQNGSPRQKKKAWGGGGASPGLTDTLSKEQFKYDREKLNLKKYYKAFRIR